MHIWLVNIYTYYAILYVHVLHTCTYRILYTYMHTHIYLHIPDPKVERSYWGSFLPGGWQGPAGSPATWRLLSLQEVHAVVSFPLKQDLQDEWQSAWGISNRDGGVYQKDSREAVDLQSAAPTSASPWIARTLATKPHCCDPPRMTLPDVALTSSPSNEHV